MPVIFHVTTSSEWDAAKPSGHYSSPSLQDEGFIHCSASEAQVQGVLKRYFSGRDNLVKLVIDTDLLENRFIYEWSPSTQDTFPHIYGPINVTAVISVEPI